MSDKLHFEPIRTGTVDMQALPQAFPNVIWSSDIGVDDRVVRVECVQFQAEYEGNTYCIMILRHLLVPESDGSQLVLAQHLSHLFGAVMGSTAFLAPYAAELPNVEQTIARNALGNVIDFMEAKPG